MSKNHVWNLLLLLVVVLLGRGVLYAQDGTVEDAFLHVKAIHYPADGQPVDSTVAVAIQRELAPQARIMRSTPVPAEAPGVLTVAVQGEGFQTTPPQVPGDNPWVYFQLDEQGSGRLVSSGEHLLYMLFTRIRDEWQDESIEEVREGRLLTPSFRWITGMDGFSGTPRFYCNGYDPEASIRELAGMGISHIVVSAPSQPYPLEDGPSGEIYYRFYSYHPDLDQYVATRLNDGVYPPGYLQQNLKFVQDQARLAVKYGITPGIHAANPRSVPEALLQRYPYLRGARVDHTFRAYQPRYTLTLAHPLVRWHYAELMRELLSAVPELEFMITLLNDSGAGFEYTASLYPGRNGGPYIVREWRSDEEIARAAAENVIRYYQTLRDAAHEVNPDFRIITGLHNIREEEEIILEGMADGLDRRTGSQRMEKYDLEEWNRRKQKYVERGSYLFSTTSGKGSSYILGMPAPWEVYKNLRTELDRTFRRVELYTDPVSLAPYDVNREMITAFQLGEDVDPEVVVRSAATEFVGSEYADELMAVWRKADAAVAATPTLPLYGNYGFTRYRFWVRPFVPDIEAIPLQERQYYEEHLLSVFNNPHNVDFQADALWDIHSVEECDSFVVQFDTRVRDPLDSAITRAERLTGEIPADVPAREVFIDQRDRLKAYKCYARTLRNISAWIAGVHGYLEAESEDVRSQRLQMVRTMVKDELENARTLLDLWENSSVSFMPVLEDGENMHEYGENFGELVRKKIALMERYGDREPYIDPDYMWRLPGPADEEVVPKIDEEEYMGY